jgi:competence protein ComFC
VITSERPIYGLYRLLWSGLDYIYPPLCGGCGKRGKRWCDDCRESSKRIFPPYCSCCGGPTTGASLCERCKSNPPAYIALRSWAIYCGPIRRAIHQLKYRRDIALGEVLATGLVSMLDQLNWQVDMVIPVPLGKTRQNERGYNQAAMLALPLAYAKGIPYKSRALKRVQETNSQVYLNRGQRAKNVQNAFGGDTNIVKGHTILIVDDVTTTGATMHASAKALLEAGAACVYGITLARAG